MAESTNRYPKARDPFFFRVEHPDQAKSTGSRSNPCFKADIKKNVNN